MSRSAWVDGDKDDEKDGKQNHAVQMLAGYLSRMGVAI